MSDDFDEDDLDDREIPEPSDMDDDAVDEDAVDTETCPRCGREVYHESATCPYCGAAISSGGSTTRRGVLFAIVTVVLVIAFITVFALKG